jgi:4-hydroxy-tetrahydrodipicolinate synthase
VPASMKALRPGMWTALVTPFAQDGSVDFLSFRKLVQRQLDAGVQALVPCGTTGEATTLLDSEKTELVRICVEMSAGSIPVVAGAGDNDTRKAIATHLLMKEAGADATLHVTPYYNKPTQEGLYRHFRAIAESSELPVVLYNNPSRTAVDMLPSTTLRLAQDVPNIVAIKETSFDCARVQKMIDQFSGGRPDFLVFAGEDALVYSFLTMGGHGGILTSANFAPDVFCDLFKSMSAKDLKAARQHFGRIATLAPLMFVTTNPIPVKTALSFLGLIESNFRLPLCPMDEAQAKQLKADLTTQGWL